MAGHESILHSESLGLLVVKPAEQAGPEPETAQLLLRARAGDLARL